MSSIEQDEAELRRLDRRWNEAYQRHDRTPLRQILADDFLGLLPSGQWITKADLVIDPVQRASAVVFSEEGCRVFGDTGITSGRLQLTLEDRCVDQRFLRVFARRGGGWQAVSVSVMPLAPT